MALTGCIVTFVSVTVERLGEAREALSEGQAQMARGAHAEAMGTFSRGKARVQALPGSKALLGQLDDQLRRAGRANAVDQLHAVTERLRLLVATDALPDRDLWTLEGALSHGLGSTDARGRRPRRAARQGG